MYKGISASKEFCYLLQFDGLSFPNPGETSSGAVIFCPDGKILCEAGSYLPTGTNNTAEYGGLLLGLRLAIQHDVKNLHIEGDSQLVIQQSLGKWAVNNLALKALNAEVKVLLEEFDYVALRHVRRENNTHADGITNEVIQSKTAFVRNTKEPSSVVSVKPEPESEILIILKDIQAKLGVILDKIQ